MEKGVESEYSCAVLHGDRSPQERRSNLAAFKEGDVRLLVCTDVAARGIDVQELPFVINMTLPDRPEDYLHRIGRCGRAETMGLAVSLVGTDKEKVWYHTCASRGRDCSNTRLVEQGGCCIWYDETAMLKVWASLALHSSIQFVFILPVCFDASYSLHRQLSNAFSNQFRRWKTSLLDRKLVVRLRRQFFF